MFNSIVGIALIHKEKLPIYEFAINLYGKNNIAIRQIQGLTQDGKCNHYIIWSETADIDLFTNILVAVKKIEPLLDVICNIKATHRPRHTQNIPKFDIQPFLENAHKYDRYYDLCIDYLDSAILYSDILTIYAVIQTIVALDS